MQERSNMILYIYNNVDSWVRVSSAWKLYINHLKRHKRAFDLTQLMLAPGLYTCTSSRQETLVISFSQNFERDIRQAGNLHCFMAGETLWRLKNVHYFHQSAPVAAEILFSTMTLGQKDNGVKFLWAAKWRTSVS